MKRLHTTLNLVLILLVLAGCSLGTTPDAPQSVAESEPSATTLSAQIPTSTPTIQPTTAIAVADTPRPTPTPVPTQPPPAPSSVAGIVAGLQGLPIDEFFDLSYRELLLRDPQALTALGLSEAFGLRHDRLNDLSDAFVRETQDLESAILDLLHGYDRKALAREQQITYDVYEWWLDNQVRGQEFMYHDYPLHHFLGSWDDRLIRLFTEIHPFDKVQDAEDYVARLSEVERQAGQVLDGLRKREEMGVIPPQFVVSMSATNLRGIASTSARQTPFYSTFSQKLDTIEGLTDKARTTLLEEAESKIANSVIPGFQLLADYMAQLQTVATDDAGVWKLPKGDAYYAYILRDQASADMTPDEVHELGLNEVARIQAEIRQAFDQLGYPRDAALGELMQRAIDEAGYMDIKSQAGKERLIQAHEELLEKADHALDAVVDIRPRAGVEVVGGPMGGYYVAGSADGSRPGAFHVRTTGNWASKFTMPTIAYHEAIPGHHFQIAIAQEMDLPLLRNDLFFNGYAEGWALYAERLAWELGLYEDDPYGNLGRLQLELLRAVRLVVDTGIHAKRWTRSEAKSYLTEALGDPSGRWSHEVDRYIVRPAQATGYKIGMLKILELRQKARDALGQQFDIIAFHNIVVGNASMPLDILENVVQDYIDARLAEGSTGSD